MRLQRSAVLELDRASRTMPAVALAALATAALVAIASLAGIAAPAIYARETPLWRVQGIGQDWANLLVDVPWLVVSALLALRGSRRARFLLGGAFAYTAYAYALYAFDVHFNAVFLVYCGALGVSAYALVALAPELREAAGWFDRRAPRRFAGALEMACASAFAVLWLSQIVAALVRGASPVDVDAAGLMTNPVHVLDLALVLPAMFVGGWLLWHGRPLGYAIVPVLLGFTVLMGAALAGMAVALVIEHMSASAVLVGAFAGFVAVATVALAWLLHHVSAEC